MKRSGPKTRTKSRTKTPLTPRSDIESAELPAGVTPALVAQHGPLALVTISTLRELLRLPFRVREATPGYEALLGAEVIARGPTPEKAWISGTRALLNVLSRELGVPPWYALVKPDTEAPPPPSE